MSVVGNSIAVQVFWPRAQTTPTVPELFLLNISIVNLLLAIATYPAAMISAFARHWVFGEIGTFHLIIHYERAGSLQTCKSLLRTEVRILCHTNGVHSIRLGGRHWKETWTGEAGRLIGLFINKPFHLCLWWIMSILVVFIFFQRNICLVPCNRREAEMGGFSFIVKLKVQRDTRVAQSSCLQLEIFIWCLWSRTIPQPWMNRRNLQCTASVWSVPFKRCRQFFSLYCTRIRTNNMRHLSS